MRQMHLLLVEDNEGDILLITEALNELKVVSRVSVQRDGERAIDFLNQTDNNNREDLPDFLLLDINLPKKNGHEVLSFVKNKDSIKHIPVIIFTTSSSPEDINRSYQQYANCFITKPMDINQFMDAIGEIKNFWINLVKLPTAIN